MTYMTAIDSSCLWFGPVSALPSWHWVGADIAEYLKRWMAVRYFVDVSELPDHALVFWVKRPGDGAAAEAIVRRKLKVLFFPVDCFKDTAAIAAHRNFIDAATLVCLHARSLAPYFPDAELAYVDHYNKYGVSHRQRMPGDRYLWVGGFQYVPYVLDVVERLTGVGRILLLTDQECQAARAAAQVNAERMGMRDFERRLARANVDLVSWSEQSQQAALLTCKAAFDVKFEGCFNQRHKPPTKMQKYLCSGIPCAINEGVALRDQLGWDVASLSQLKARSADQHYLGGIAAYSEKLSAELSLDNVARRYLMLARAAERDYTAGLAEPPRSAASVCVS